MPVRLSWRSARRSSGSSIVVVSFGGGATVEQVAVEGELTDQRIDLPEHQGRGRMALEVAADDLVAGPGEVEGDGARAVDGRGPVRAGEGEEALDAPDGAQRILGVERGGELADVRADGGGAGEQLERRGQRAPGAVVGVFAVLPGVLALVLAQEGPGAQIEDADGARVPLDQEFGPDAARRDAVVGLGDLDAAVEVHGAGAEGVVAEGRRRERAKMRTRLGKHRGDPGPGPALESRLGPAGLPASVAGPGGHHAPAVQ